MRTLVGWLREAGFGEGTRLPSRAMDNAVGNLLVRLNSYVQPAGVGSYLRTHIGRTPRYDTEQGPPGARAHDAADARHRARHGARPRTPRPHRPARPARLIYFSPYEKPTDSAHGPRGGPRRRRVRARPVRAGAGQAERREAEGRPLRHPQRLRARQHHGDGDERGRHHGGRQVRDRSREHPRRAQEDHQPAGEVRDQHAPSRRSQRRQRQAAGAWARRW